MSNFPPPPQNRKKFRKNSSVLNTNGLSKTDRGGTLKRLLLHTTPRLKKPGKARRTSPSAITEPKAFPAPFCTRACARKASPTPPTPLSARLEIILQHGRSSYISLNPIIKWLKDIESYDWHNYKTIILDSCKF